jgi:hypothetical protein
VREVTFELRVKSGSWEPEDLPARAMQTAGYTSVPMRMTGFTLTVRRDGVALGGHNIQAHVHAPGHKPGPYDDADRPDLTLASGWGVWFRNQFAQAPDVAARIIGSIEAELSQVTAELARAGAAESTELSERLFANELHATGPDYWC